MNGTHPTAELLDRYRRRAASPAETLTVDAHVAACDRCFNAVRADAHLTYAELEALADDREPAHPHLGICDRCRGELTDLRHMRQAIEDAHAPRRPWWPLAAAAMLLIVFGAAWLFFRTAPARTPNPIVVATAPPPAPAPAPETIPLERPAILDTLVTTTAVLRGDGATSSQPADSPRRVERPSPQSPVATVVLDERPQFRWAEVEGATTYEVTVVDLDRGTVAASGTSNTDSWQPAEPLPRGRTYLWEVAAETSRGRVVAPGRNDAEARFHVSPQSSIDAKAPLERGIAFARLGALDDAERELARAGATELLGEVRGWRQRALPTTTNGAQ